MGDSVISTPEATFAAEQLPQSNGVALLNCRSSEQIGRSHSMDPPTPTGDPQKGIAKLLDRSSKGAVVTNNIGFRYVWPVKVCPRQLANGESTILHISPKFSTVHEHVSFQWTLKMYGAPETEDDDVGTEQKVRNGDVPDDEDADSCSSVEKGYVAISLYYLDGPVSSVKLKAQVRIAGERRDGLEERNSVSASRGGECELSFKDRVHLTGHIHRNIGHLIRLSLLLELDAGLFRVVNYLNAVSPTPYHSFLTANYRARVGSKVWKKQSNRRPRSASDGHTLLCGYKKLDLEKTFSQVMEREREEEAARGERKSQQPSRRGSRRPSIITATTTVIKDFLAEERTCAALAKEESEQPQMTTLLSLPANDPQNCPRNSLTPPPPLTLVRPSEPHVFKKLLVACCESCERRASLVPSLGERRRSIEEARKFSCPPPSLFQMSTAASVDASGHSEDDDDDEGELEGEGEEQRRREEVREGHDGQQQGDDEDPTSFECDEENKAEIHDTLANMYFNRVVLPDLEYVEDFVDFLIDAELNDLPVLKRACERYLCGELDSKKELMTSLILDFFFIAMVFQLPVMKSMTLTELCDRYSELEDVEWLLEQEEYQNIDKRIRQLCGDRNLHDLVDECKRFREQCLRVQRVDLTKDGPKRLEEQRKEQREMSSHSMEEESEGRDERGVVLATKSFSAPPSPMSARKMVQSRRGTVPKVKWIWAR